MTAQQAMATDVYSLGRMLLQILTGCKPDHPIFCTVECGRDLTVAEPSVGKEGQTQNRQGRSFCDCCAAVGAGGGGGAGGGEGGEPVTTRRTVPLERLSPSARDLIAALTREDPAIRPTVDMCVDFAFPTETFV